MPRSRSVVTAEPVRVLTPEEYPTVITADQGAYRPEVWFAAQHPLGLYYVYHEGAGSLGAYFLPRRKGSRPKRIGSANSMAGAFQRISHHEDERINPDVPRERGASGPVSIHALGRRTSEKKTPTQLDHEIEQFLRRA